MCYDEAMGRFGSDAPDTRYGMELCDLSEIVKTSGFKVFAGAVASGGTVRGISVPGGAALFRKETDDLTQLGQYLGAKGLAWIKWTAGGPESPIAKFFKPEELSAIRGNPRRKKATSVFSSPIRRPSPSRCFGLLRKRHGRKAEAHSEGNGIFSGS